MEQRVDVQVSGDQLETPRSEVVTVSCSVCQHEIPLSVAISREASDYVEYYCGLECFEQWRKRSGA